MNKSYKSVWNEALGTWIAASELASARGKASRSVVLKGIAAVALITAAQAGHASTIGVGTGGAPGGSASCDTNNSATVGVGPNGISYGGTALVDGNGNWSTVAGCGANANNVTGATVYGANTTVTGDYGTAVGLGSIAGNLATAVGVQAQASGTSSSSLGFNAVAAGSDSVALGVNASASADNSVALGAGSTTTADLSAAAYNPAGSRALVGVAKGEVSVGSAGNQRRVTNVAAGSASTDAVNVSQLKNEAGKSNNIGTSAAAAIGGGATYDALTGSISQPNYSVGGVTVNNVGDAVSNLDDRVTDNTKDIATNATGIADVQNQISSGSIGLVQQDATTREITVGRNTDGTVMNVAGTAGNRTVTGVAAGTVNASSVDAINGGQLYANAGSVSKALGGGSTVNADGSISQPNYSVGGVTVHSVGEVASNLDDRVTDNTKDIATNATGIADVQNQISSGSVGLVQQDATTREITVGRNTDGTVMNVAGTAGNRTVTGVAAGTVNASSVDAINGGQLYANADSVSKALGGGSMVNADGSISQPNYSVGGTTVHSVGEAVSNLDDRVTDNTKDITNLQGKLGDVGTQLSGAVQYDHNADGSMNFGSVTLGGSLSAGPVVLSNVANGVNQYDAVNYGQLSTLQNQVTDIRGQVSSLNAQMSDLPSSTTLGSS
ncbi:transporter, partial [Paraburkholderia sp. 31.1]|uniref:YadA family autotransporter adhesin n=1 Tax=Paraburkholderia sp. 31.1 TaxID=2615205 RepID=UPI001DC7EBBB